MEWITKHILTSTAGLGLLLTIIARIVNNTKLIALFGNLGKGLALLIYNFGNILSKIGLNISQKASLKFGKKIWERIEDFLENSIVVSARAFYIEYQKIIPINTISFLWNCFSIKGFDSDNGNNINGVK